MVAPHLSTGKQAETAACQYLKKQGLAILTTNYSCRIGEIDIIARDKNSLVFIEVRFRKNSSHGSGLESVTYRKQQKIRRTAQLYLLQEKLTDKIPVRFDVIGVSGQPLEFEWIRNAF